MMESCAPLVSRIRNVYHPCCNVRFESTSSCLSLGSEEGSGSEVRKERGERKMKPSESQRQESPVAMVKRKRKKDGSPLGWKLCSFSCCSSRPTRRPVVSSFLPTLGIDRGLFLNGMQPIRLARAPRHVVSSAAGEAETALLDPVLLHDMDVLLEICMSVMSVIVTCPCIFLLFIYRRDVVGSTSVLYLTGGLCPRHMHVRILRYTKDCTVPTWRSLKDYSDNYTRSSRL